MRLIITNSIRRIRSGFNFFFLLSFFLLGQYLLELAKVFDKAFVWRDYRSLLSDPISGLLVSNTVFLHEKSYHNRWTSRFSHHAVNKHVMVVELFSDVEMGFVKEGQDTLWGIVVDLKPFVMFDALLFDLVLNFTSMIRLFVDHGHHAVDIKVKFEERVPQDVDPAEVQITFVFRFFFLFKYV